MMNDNVESHPGSPLGELTAEAGVVAVLFIYIVQVEKSLRHVLYHSPCLYSGGRGIFIFAPTRCLWSTNSLKGVIFFRFRDIED
jgi:hypothetical protein